MTELTEFQRKLSALLPDVELRFEEALAKHTSFRIGGDAEVMAFPKTRIELADILKEKGYPIARRTVAKYRQQLNIPVARLRK